MAEQRDTEPRLGEALRPVIKEMARLVDHKVEVAVHPLIIRIEVLEREATALHPLIARIEDLERQLGELAPRDTSEDSASYPPY
jgi:hypothetical protein